MTSEKIKAALKNFGLPRLIIAGFLLLLLIMAPFVGADLPTQISNIINRFSWNGILVLAMVPMVHSGCGLNFGRPLGIISGLLGATLSIELGFTGPLSFLAAILIATPFALILGALYGWLLNKIKGGEMMIATYVGILYRRSCQFPSDQYRFCFDPDRNAPVLRPAGFWHLGISAYQDRNGHDGSRLQSRICQGGGYQRRQHPNALSYHVHMAGSDRNPGL